MSRLLAGRYELVDKIGEGGMAVVYRAKDRLLNRYVAIKILRPEYTRDEVFIESFRRESQAAAALQHPNIVAVYDVGKAGNINYIVMELVDGRPLSELIQDRAPLEYKEVMNYSKQIASALSLAHKHQIIHRDVKPHNILVTTDGVAKLTDFGIAKAVSNSTAMADTSKIIGSVHYFSPEQARGSYVDERSDIYSLGIVMYEMLTGRVPFDGDNPVEVALKHINEDMIPPSKITAGIPPQLEKLVLKATDKFQTNRYKSADEMLEDIANIEFTTNYLSSGVNMATEASKRQSPGGIRSVPVDEKELDNISKGKIVGTGSSGGNRNSGGKGSNDGVKKTLFIIIGVILGALIMLLIVMGISKMFSGGGSDEVKVPNLVNLTYEQAVNELEKVGLEINRGDDISSDDVPEGLVAQQIPIADSNVKKGKSITVRVSSGPGDIPVPDLMNRTFEEAEAVLLEAGLKITRGEDVFSASIPEGKIAGQQPEARKTAKPGEAVTVFVSKGEEINTAEVPDLTGIAYTSRDEMDSYLSGYGFRLGDVSESESAMEPWTIIDQSPAPNTSAEKGSFVNVVIAVEPTVTTVSVPFLVGMTMSEAVYVCEDRGLEVVLGDLVEDPTGTGTPGTIISQNYDSGEEVEPGTVITVYVIKEPEGEDSGEEGTNDEETTPEE